MDEIKAALKNIQAQLTIKTNTGFFVILSFCVAFCIGFGIAQFCTQNTALEIDGEIWVNYDWSDTYYQIDLLNPRNIKSIKPDIDEL